MAHLQYPLLETHYDLEHRAHLMADNGEVLKPLRPRFHTPLPWDERYTTYIRLAGFLPLARVVNSGLPRMDGSALTALVDRWRPETHTLHLVCGELTVTLEDVAMILGLPIDGAPVIGDIQPVGWRDMVEALIGRRPPEPEGKDRRPAGVLISWLKQQFSACPQDVDQATVERFARVWLWYLLGSFLFPDSTGDTVSWMYLPLLANWEAIRTYSWGSAVLAWLYRQLCEACRRTGNDSNIGGCLYLLQIWMWERFPIGRPIRLSVEHWPHNDEESLPTIAYLWRSITPQRGQPQSRYLSYMNEFDVITPGQVTWCPYSRPEVVDMVLSPMCRRDAAIWLTRAPLINFHVVEYHLPHRVMRQFGKMQTTPPLSWSSSQVLHSVGRRKRFNHTDWRHFHRDYMTEWEDRAQRLVIGSSTGDHTTAAFTLYLRWLHGVTRLRLKPTLTEADIAEQASDAEDEYDKLTRMGTQPEHGALTDYMGKQLARITDEARQALKVPPGSTQEVIVLRDFVELVQRRCRRLAAKMSCIATPDVLPSITRGTSSSGDGSHRASFTRGAAQGASSFGQYEADDSEDHDVDDGTEQAVLEASQLVNAPTTTKPSLPRVTKRRHATDHKKTVAKKMCTPS